MSAMSVICGLWDEEEEEHLCQLPLLLPKSVMEMRECMRAKHKFCS